jgi:polyhydroxybutyrate depolymerase
MIELEQMKKIIILIAIVFFLIISFRDQAKAPVTDSPNTDPADIVETEINSSGEYGYSILVDGLTRYFNVYIPKGYDERKLTPLVINLHGGAGDMASAQKQSQMNLKADEAIFIVVYPQGVMRPLAERFGIGGGTWNAGPISGGYAYNSKVNDVAFIEAIIDDLAQRFTIDTSRVYATGLSMGGMMSYRLACELSDKIAAVAPIASNLTLVTSDCNPVRPVPVIHFHGKADRIIPYFGGDTDPAIPKIFVIGGGYPPVTETISFFAQKYSCGIKNETYKNGQAVCETSSGCRAEAEVTLCSMENSGHTWPGGVVVNTDGRWSEYVGEVSTDISANDIMWEFFKKHRLDL